VEERWKDFLKAEGARQLNREFNGKAKKMSDIGYVVCWIGDIAYLYI
jgi:hypothetical protein